MVVLLKMLLVVIMECIFGRWVYEVLGRVYNIIFNLFKVVGVDDVIGELLVCRVDDSEEVYC